MKTIFSLAYFLILSVFLGYAQSEMVAVAFNQQTNTNELIAIDTKSGAISLLPENNSAYKGLRNAAYYDSKNDLIITSESDFDRYRNEFRSFKLRQFNPNNGQVSDNVSTGLKQGLVTASNVDNEVNLFGGQNKPNFVGGPGVFFVRRVNLQTGNISQVVFHPELSLPRDVAFVPASNSAFVMTVENQRYELIELNMSNGEIIRRLKSTLQMVSIENNRKETKITFDPETNLLYLAGSSRSDNNQMVVTSFNVATGAEKIVYQEYNEDTSKKITSLLLDKANNQLVARFEQRGADGFDVTFNAINLGTGKLSKISDAPGYTIRFSELLIRGSQTVTDPDPDPDTTFNVEFKITLDNYPQETSWKVLNDRGSEVASSNGTYRNRADGSVVTENLKLTAGCYTLEISDSYGDGICCGYGSGSYTLSLGSTILASGGSFGSIDRKAFCVGTDQKAPNLVADQSNFSQPLDNFRIFPTVTSDALNVVYKIKGDSNINISVLDLTGKVIINKNFDASNNKDISFNTQKFANGTYFLRVTENGNSRTQKFIVVK